MHNILITGGAGFLGSHLADKLIKMNHKVTIFDSLDPSVHHDGRPPEYLNPKSVFIKGDVCDYNHLKSVVKDKNIIFHMAAQVGGVRSLLDIKKYVDVNVAGTANLFDILINTENCCNKLILASSAVCYGEGEYKCVECGIGVSDKIERSVKNLKKKIWNPLCNICGEELSPCPTKESKPLDCDGFYAISKRAQEDIAVNFSKTFRFPVVILRYFNLFGPRQSILNPYTGFATIFIALMNRGRKPYIAEDGLQLRDFVPVCDAVDASILAMDSENADFKVFNVGSGKKRTILDFASSLIKIFGTGLSPHITYQPSMLDIRHCYADIRKIKNYLGFRPSAQFDKSVKELVDWMSTPFALDKLEQAKDELRKHGISDIL